MSELKLYNYFRSSTSYRARIALELKKLNYTYVAISLQAGEQNQDAYRKLNPIGGVPTLEHNGKLLSQSFAIIEYLDEMFKSGVNLFPEDIYHKAKMRQVCETINADIHPLQNLKVTQFLDKKLNVSPEQKQLWLNHWIGGGVKAVEKLLLPFAREFSFGDAPSAVDAFLVPQVFSAQRFNVDISDCINILRVNENCLKHPAFQKAHPYRQPDTPAELKL